MNSVKQLLQPTSPISAEITHFATRGQLVGLFQLFDGKERPEINWLHAMWDAAYSDQQMEQMKRLWADRLNNFTPPEDDWTSLAQ